VLCADFGCCAQLVVDGRPIGFLVFDTPEIEAANAIGLKCLAELNAAVEYLVLVLEVGIGVELIRGDPLWTEAHRASSP